MGKIKDETIRLNSGGIEFRFELKCKKDLELGPVTIDQWWMPIPSLYGQRTAEPCAHNRLEVLRYYGAAMRHVGALDERSAQEQLVLASLVPEVRSQGSRSIFNDAFLVRPNSKNARAEVADLERLIGAEPGKKCSRTKFHKDSWDLLGHGEFPAGSQECYSEVARTLLEGPCASIARGHFEEAVAEAVATWKRLTKRRHFTEEKRAAIDALSYEARASFHAAYSFAWRALLNALEQMGALNSASLRFHRLWHTDHRDSEFGTSLFHGHVFALHPAFGPFILTATGRRLIGDWLAAPDSSIAFRKLLRGLQLSIYHYADAKLTQQQRRQRTLRNKRSEAARAAIRIAERNKSRGKKR